LDIFNDFKDVRLPIIVGISPSNKFHETFNEFNEVRFPIQREIEPLKKFSDKSLF